MEEFNKKTLIEALSSMKEHEPPDFVWERIDLEIEIENEKMVSQKMLSHLPKYEPPAKVWRNIVYKIETGDSPRIIGFGWRKVLAVAASLAILLTAYFYYQDTPDHDTAFITKYATEIIDEQLFKQDWKEDEADFVLYQELCEAKPYICDQPEFQFLESELVELSGAIKDIETAIGSYGASAELISQVKEIELERTDVLKKITAMLI